MDGPKKSGKPLTQAERRQLRLEDQLRTNLLKRKALARARRDEDTAQATTENSGDVAPPDLPRGPRSD